jgi:hypothetical protein
MNFAFIVENTTDFVFNHSPYPLHLPERYVYDKDFHPRCHSTDSSKCLAPKRLGHPNDKRGDRENHANKAN